jgi:sugar/nucleoside kinase (ribokinase family)
MALVIVGTVAFDSIETPAGRVDHVLGGSGTFSSYAASFFTKPRLVGVVGEDFPDHHRRLLADRHVDITGVVIQKGGQTFFWHGRYHADMNARDTLDVQLNVLATFDPVLPDSYRDSTHVFLANNNPVIQAKVLDQVTRPRLVLADTMDFWITTMRQELLHLLPRVDGLLLNDSEALLLTGDSNMVRAARKVLDLGPRFTIIKRGEHGSLLCTADGVSVLPAFPTDRVIDPTGAGDSYAGGLLGYLTGENLGAADATPSALRKAIAVGTVTASLTVEDFGLDRLKQVTGPEIQQRLAAYRAMLAF